MSRSLELISEIIIDSFRGVLSAHVPDAGECRHRRVLSVEDSGGNETKVALVEFNGPELRGFLQLFLIEEFVDPILLYDDAGEFLNQVAGRLSNRLYDYGFDITNTTPRIVRSDNSDYQKCIPDSEIFYTTDSLNEFKIKTVIGPVNVLEQLAERRSIRKNSALKEGSMLFFDSTERED